jgi:precorrin-3B methylase
LPAARQSASHIERKLHATMKAMLQTASLIKAKHGDDRVLNPSVSLQDDLSNLENIEPFFRVAAQASRWKVEMGSE